MQCYWLSRLVVIEGFEFECINEVVDVYIAINRRACVVPAKDVPDRRPRRNCNCWFDLGCSRIEVGSNGLTVYLHVVVTRPFFFSNFMRQQAMSSRMLFNRAVPVNRLVNAIADSVFNFLFVPGSAISLTDLPPLWFF